MGFNSFKLSRGNFLYKTNLIKTQALPKTCHVPRCLFPLSNFAALLYPLQPTSRLFQSYLHSGCNLRLLASRFSRPKHTSFMNDSNLQTFIFTFHSFLSRIKKRLKKREEEVVVAAFSSFLFFFYFIFPTPVLDFFFVIRATKETRSNSIDF